MLPTAQDLIMRGDVRGIFFFISRLGSVERKKLVSWLKANNVFLARKGEYMLEKTCLKHKDTVVVYVCDKCPMCELEFEVKKLHQALTDYLTNNGVI